jgi:diguanylate cyclase (GGDEF)-like protein
MVLRIVFFTSALSAAVVLLASALTGLLFWLSGLEQAGLREVMMLCAGMCLLLAPPVLGSLVVLSFRLQTHIQRLQEAALTDPLTGLANRRAFFEAATRLLSEAPGAPDRPLHAVLMIDVDRFKALNDRLGHEAGDAALAHLAARITDSLARAGEDQALVARLGGEEFVVLLPGVTEAGARLAAETVCRGVRSSSLVFGDERITMTVSVGVSTSDRPDLHVTLAAADQAVYAAKSAGRDGWVLRGDDGGPPVRHHLDPAPRAHRSRVRTATAGRSIRSRG